MEGRRERGGEGGREEGEGGRGWKGGGRGVERVEGRRERGGEGGREEGEEGERGEGGGREWVLRDRGCIPSWTLRKAPTPCPVPCL